MFEETNEYIKNTYGKWFQVFDYKNTITIEFFPYVTGIFFPFNIFHCTKRIALNQCYFIDEEGKKPDIDPFQKEAGLYHPNCHCMERNIESPKVKDITI